MYVSIYNFIIPYTSTSTRAHTLTHTSSFVYVKIATYIKIVQTYISLREINENRFGCFSFQVRAYHRAENEKKTLFTSMSLQLACKYLKVTTFYLN